MTAEPLAGQLRVLISTISRDDVRRSRFALKEEHMKNRNRWIRLAMRAGLVAAAALLLPLATWGQTDVTTTRLGGVVQSDDGQPLPGALIEVKSLDTGATARAVSDSEGRFRVLNLPSGEYAFSVSLEGFKTGGIDRFRLLLGETPWLRFTLHLESSDEIVVLDHRPEVELTNTSNATTFQSEQIESIPQLSRDIKELATLAPQASIEGERRSLALSGQRGINTNVTIDGVDFNNAFFGGTVGTAEGRAPLSISIESIKEFSVITNGASVEFGRSGGGFVNVVTKSGTNQLRASAFYTHQPQSLISNFPNGVEPADQKRKQYGGSIGGRIVEDRLFFFASYDRQDKSVTIPTSSTTLDPDIFARYPELASPASFAQTQDGDVLFGRLDYLYNPQHRFMLRGNFTKYDGMNGTYNSTTRVESYNGNEGLDTDAWVASWSGTFGNSMINDLNVNYIKEDTPRQDKGLGLPSFQVSGVGDYGEVYFLPITSTAKRKAIGDTFSYSHGNHIAKFGFEYNDTSISQIFKGNWRGVFRFNNKADFLAGHWSQYYQFGGLNGLTADEAGKADFGQKETAIFLQDQWFYRPNLTFTFGVRLEDLDNPNAPILNPRDVNPDGSFNLTGRVPDQNLTDQISPRFGVAWSPGRDQKTAVRFAAGRYWSRTPALLLAQLFTSNGVRGTQYTVFTTSVNGVVQPPTDPLAPGWGDAFVVPGTERIDFTQIVGNQSPPGVFAMEPNFENPYTDRATLNIEREILPLTVVSLDLTYAKGHQLQRLTDPNLQYDGTTSANGLPHYSKTRPNSYYGRITTSVSDAESKYRSIGASIRRRLHDGFQYSAQVTWSKDEDNDSNERNFAGVQAEDVNNLGLNWGPSNRDQTWRIGLSALWETPWWGISVSGAYRYASGTPWTISTGSDTNGDTVFADRPTINGVHVGRNSENQPSSQAIDLRIAKTFTIQNVAASIFAECFNCTDEANWVVPSNNYTWGNANLSTPSRSNYGLENGVNSFIPPRTIQFGVRFDLN